MSRCTSRLFRHQKLDLVLGTQWEAGTSHSISRAPQPFLHLASLTLRTGMRGIVYEGKGGADGRMRKVVAGGMR